MRKWHPILGPMLSSIPTANSPILRVHLHPRTTPKALFKSLITYPLFVINNGRVV